MKVTYEALKAALAQRLTVTSDANGKHLAEAFLDCLTYERKRYLNLLEELQCELEKPYPNLDLIRMTVSEALTPANGARNALGACQTAVGVTIDRRPPVASEGDSELVESHGCSNF